MEKMKNVRNRAILIYIVYIVIGVLLIGRFSLQQKEKFNSVQYGVSTDETIEITADKEIVCNVILKKDNFEGISVRFQAENKFQNEQLTVQVFDSETKELLATDTVDLKYERIQNKDYGSTMYFVLPIKDAKGRDVQFQFSMENNQGIVSPYLVLSKNHVEESKLYVDGILQKKSLVFSARYFEGMEKNCLSAILLGGMWILTGTVLLGMFLYFKDNIEFRKNTDKIKDNHLVTLCKRHKMKIGLLFIWFSIGILCLYVYQYSIENKINKSKRVEVYETQDSIISFGNENEILLINQEFICKNNNLSGIFIPTSESNDINDTQIYVKVKNESSNEILVEGVFELREGKHEYEIPLEETLQKSKDCHISVQIEPLETKIQNIGLMLGVAKQEEDSVQTERIGLFVNDKVFDENIAIVTEHGDVSFLNKLFFFFTVCFFISVSIMYIVSFSKKLSIEHKFAVIALLFGFIFAFEIAVYTVPDEPSHIDTAYSISNKILGIQESSKPGYIYKRTDDVDMYVEQKQSINVYSYERLVNELAKPLKNDELIECAALNNLSNAGILFYFPQAIGISLGRIFQLGSMATLMMGRFMSLIAYVIICFFAIRKIPFAKISLCLIAILPISLQQAASFSYDAVINSIAFLFGAYCLAWAYQNENRIKDIVIIILAGSLLACVKGGVYLPLCLLPLLMLMKKQRTNKIQKLIIILIISIFVFSFVNKNLAANIARLMADPGTAVGGSKNAEIYTLKYVLQYPHRLIGMFVNTFYEQGDSYIRNLFGGNLAWREINISWAIVIGYIIIILFSCIKNTEENEIICIERIFMLAICIASFGLIELSMLLAWTPTTYNYITGVQGRYFMPFFIIVLAAIRNSMITIKKNVDNQLVFGCVALNAITLLQVIQLVLE